MGVVNTRQFNQNGALAMRHRSSLEVQVHALQATDDAVPAIQRLDSLCFRGGERTDIVSELDRPFTRAWVARITAFEGDAAWAGFILTWLVADELHVLNVATQPSHRRRGVGQALVQQAISFARQQHVRIVLLEVRRGNRAAIQLYRSFGFSVLNLRRGYYSDNGEDALEMSLVLDPETGEIVPNCDEVQL